MRPSGDRPDACRFVEAPAGGVQVQGMALPAGSDALHGFIPGTHPADRVGGLDVARAYGHRGGDGFCRRQIAQQGAQEAGDGGVA